MELAYRTSGDGAPLLLLHGGGEDAGMLAPQAEAFARRGRRVIWYDRRGTGASTRDGWPEGGVDQHADDAAALLRSLDAAPATVLGFSSGGVVALALAARHPDVVTEVIAWEPPVIGVLPDGLEMHTGLLARSEAYLVEHPGDWGGAYDVMLDVLSEGRADVDSPLARQMRTNAEAYLRDDGRVITRHTFAPGELAAAPATVALGSGTEPLHAMIAEYLEAELGRPSLVVDGADDHEVYLTRPDVLATALANR